MPTGRQLAPIYTQNVNQLQVVFSEQVVLSNSQVTLGRVQRRDGAAADVELQSSDRDRDMDLCHAAARRQIPARDLHGGDRPGWQGPRRGVVESDQRYTGQLCRRPGGPNVSSRQRLARRHPTTASFWFSILPGDRNQNGLVDGADLGVAGDVNGDGVSNAADTTIVQGVLNSAVSTSLPVRNRLGEYGNRGDYNDNEIVDFNDYTLWKASFGSITNLAADGGGNGVVDAADYTPWRDNLGKYSAWYSGPLPGGGSGGAPLVVFGEAPQVTNITISGSNSTHDPYSFEGHDGSGEQLRTVPVGGADTISITFSEDVNIAADTLTLTGLRTAQQPVLAEFSYDLVTMTATWRFENWTANDHYLISLSDAVTDVEGYRLDGEWTNPAHVFVSNLAVSEFPSGNGEAGGDFNFVLTLLAANAQVSNVVNIYDYYVIYANSSNPNLVNALFWQGDTNGDGLVNETDLTTHSGSINLNLSWVWLSADLNGDWTVDDADLVIFNTHLGMSNPTHAQGDLDGDGDIDVADLDLMFAQYGWH